MIATPNQTIGPFWHLLEDPAWADLTRFGAAGERIVLLGRVTDGVGAPVARACVELWQTSPAASAVWDGFGRCATDADGWFRFVTLYPGGRPGVVAGGNRGQAPHVALMILGSGLMRHLTTRVYFAGDPANAGDALLASLDAARRETLVAVMDDGGWRLDIRLQGDGETVFLDV